MGRCLVAEYNNGNKSTPKAKLIINNKTCFCNRDFTVAEFKNIVTQLRKKQDINFKARRDKNNNKIWMDKDGNILNNKDTGGKPDGGVKVVLDEISKYEIVASDGKPQGDRLFYLTAPIGLNVNPIEANYESFTKYLNEMFNNYSVKTCLQKIHFLSQSYQETKSFGHTCEENPKDSYGGGKFYRGRGLLQLTHDYNYVPYFEYWKSIPKTELGLFVFPPKVELRKVFTDFEYFVKSISINLFLACDSAGWYWKKNNINRYADLDDIRKVSAKVNNPSASENTTGVINGLAERTVIYNLLKPIFEYEKFHK